MPVQILTLKLDGITAGDYLTWCRDPDPPALDFALRSISIAADPLGDTVTAILDWNDSLPPASAAATAAGLPLPAGVEIQSLPTDESQAWPVSTAAGPRLIRALAPAPAPVASAATLDGAQPLPCPARANGRLRTAI